jgi:hypothetical protein
MAIKLTKSLPRKIRSCKLIYYRVGLVQISWIRYNRIWLLGNNRIYASTPAQRRCQRQVDICFGIEDRFDEADSDPNIIDNDTRQHFH